jgi:IS605 OrfB family transposase
MIRSSKHILNYQTQAKTVVLDAIFADYKELVELYIMLIKQKILPLKSMLTSKELPDSDKIKHSQWKQVAYADASAIVRSALKKVSSKTFARYKKLYSRCIKENKHSSFTSKRYKELNINLLKRLNINLKNVSINIDQRLVDCETGKHFDEFVRIKSPYFAQGKHKAITINLPVKHHKHSLQYNSWDRKKTIKLVAKNGNYFLCFVYEKASPQSKTSGKELGLDIGYKKLISTSDGEYYGVELFKLYEKISRAQQGSRNFKQLLTERDKLINEACNKLPIEQIQKLVIEDLKNVKHRSIFSKRFNNKLQRWSYRQTIGKLEKLCEENGVLLTKVDPAYTSQTCNQCGVVEKKNRRGELYVCSCGLETDADFNAAVNILHRGIYNSSVPKTNSLTSL